jgi:hypothetical protein
MLAERHGEAVVSMLSRAVRLYESRLQKSSVTLIGNVSEELPGKLANSKPEQPSF